MLYDPKWEVEVKADPFKLDTLIAWAERQPAEQEYDFWCNQCYLGQYFEAHGFQIKAIGTGTVTFVGQDTVKLPPYFNMIAQAEPRTFGAALARARRVALSRT